MTKKDIEEIVEKHLRDCVFCHEDMDIPFLDHIRVHNLVAELTQHHEAEVERARNEAIKEGRDEVLELVLDKLGHYGISSPNMDALIVQRNYFIMMLEEALPKPNITSDK